MTNLWYEITATVPPGLTDAVAAHMRDIAPGGVTVEEPVDILGPEMGFRVREGEPNLVRAWLPASELGAVLVSRLRTAMEAFPQVELVARPIYEEDWAVNWRQFFGVVETGGRIVVVPSWLEHEAQQGQLVIRLDPGRAFGTGHHETTRLCLRAIEERVSAGCSVLDVGTGSGILAIAAAVLGAGAVRAIDIDPVAAEVAAENAKANDVEGRIVIEAGKLDPDAAGRHDLVVANISANANIELAPAFTQVTAPGGALVLSGLLAEDVGRVRDAVEGPFRFVRVSYEGDWALLEFEYAGDRATANA